VGGLRPKSIRDGQARKASRRLKALSKRCEKMDTISSVEDDDEKNHALRGSAITERIASRMLWV